MPPVDVVDVEGGDFHAAGLGRVAVAQRGGRLLPVLGRASLNFNGLPAVADE
jgi:hypothetical protein